MRRCSLPFRNGLTFVIHQGAAVSSPAWCRKPELAMGQYNRGCMQVLQYAAWLDLTSMPGTGADSESSMSAHSMFVVMGQVAQALGIPCAYAYVGSWAIVSASLCMLQTREALEKMAASHEVHAYVVPGTHRWLHIFRQAQLHQCLTNGLGSCELISSYGFTICSHDKSRYLLLMV